MSLFAQDERLARRLGAITLLVLAVAIGGVVFMLDRTALGTPTRIRVLFRNTTGLRERAALIVAGQPIGKVEAITPVLHGSSKVLGGEVGVAVTVAIEEGNAWKVPADAEIFMASRGPLADKYLEVAPGSGEPVAAVAAVRAVHDGLELRGIDTPSLDNVLQRTWTNLTTFKQFLEAVAPELEALRTQLGVLRGQLDTLASDPSAGGGVRALAARMRELIATGRQTYETSLGGDAGLARFRATVENAREVIALARTAIDVVGPPGAAAIADLGRVRGHLAAADPIVRARQTIATMRGVIDRIDPLLAKLDEIVERIAAGEGSLGRLMQDPEFPEDAKDLGKVLKRQPWKILERPED